MKADELIVGAGLAGLIAAFKFPRAEIIEAAPGFRENHKAVLRFRSDAISEITGIPFRKTTVRKAIAVWGNDGWEEGPLTLAAANAYSLKVAGSVSDRSIFNLAPEPRWIAPRYFHEALYARFSDRITFGEQFDFQRPAISTAPLPVALKSLGIPFDGSGDYPAISFTSKPIRVLRYAVDPSIAEIDENVSQTFYVPDAGTYLYRLSILNREIIAEHVIADGDHLEEEPVDGNRAFDTGRIAAALFGIPWRAIHCTENVIQKNGKLVPLDPLLRKRLLFTMTRERQIYSLGRFATWRNILLDDVPRDCEKVKAMINLDEGYDSVLAVL